MNGYSALTSDGTREIIVRTSDSGVSTTAINTVYSITYDACYNGCDDIQILNKVNIDGDIYSFGENNISNPYFVYDGATTCVVNKEGTLITCTTRNDGVADDVVRVKLEVNTKSP